MKSAPPMIFSLIRPSSVGAAAGVRSAAPALTLFLFGMVFPTAFALAIESCPVIDKEAEESGGCVDAETAALTNAPNCRRAALLTQACDFGKWIAGYFSAKSEPLFLPHSSFSALSPSTGTDWLAAFAARS